MEDVALCPGTNCPIRRNCKRYVDWAFRSKGDKFPAWWTEPVYKDGDCRLQIVEKCCGSCRHFLYEDANGNGYCGKKKAPKSCNMSCNDFELVNSHSVR